MYKGPKHPFYTSTSFLLALFPADLERLVGTREAEEARLLILHPGIGIVIIQV